MVKGSLETPKVFISYSWSNPQYQDWVETEIAKRLIRDGVDVIFDRWDLKEGQDVHAFMEKMVNDPEIKKVLVVSDSVYQKKANAKEGGVGKESQIISKEVYENVKQKKFIPIVAELDENGDPCLPTFLASKKYINLADDLRFEQEYQNLLRILYDKPEKKKPPRGEPPAYLFDEIPVKISGNVTLKKMQSVLQSQVKGVSIFVDDYLKKLLLQLEDFRIQDENVTEDFDEKILESIGKLEPLRENFIEFSETVFKYSEEDSLLLESFKEFFENLILFTFPKQGTQRYHEYWFDNFRFFNYELMLHFIALLLSLKKYKEVSFFIFNEYFYRKNDNRLSHGSIEKFCSHVESLDELRNNRLNSQRMSITADLIKERAVNSHFSLESLVEADYIIALTSFLQYITVPTQEWNPYWFPTTTIYMGRFGKTDLVERMISKSVFEKVKPIFKVKNLEEFKSLIQKGEEQKQNFGWRKNFSRTPYFTDILELEKVASLN